MKKPHQGGVFNFVNGFLSRSLLFRTDNRRPLWSRRTSGKRILQDKYNSGFLACPPSGFSRLLPGSTYKYIPRPEPEARGSQQPHRS